MAKQNEVGVLVKDNFEQHAQHVDKATKSYGSFKTAVASALNKSRLLGFAGALKSTVDALTNASKAEAEYIESMNLLKVAYDDNTASATNLINKLKDMYGLDPAGLTKTLGTYKQMTSAMGMANETSALLSENLLKMQEDVASLYNLDFATVGKKFQSALAGQSRALYSLGVDITKTSLQQELYNMGIEKNINELNKASKTALTYIVMEKQLQNSYGDAAKTINSLANQTKIWQEQTAIAARQIKALVIPVLQVIISYANGIIMAFNAVMETILGFFGIDVEQMASQFGVGSNDIAVGFDDIGTAAAGASKNIDKMKLGLRGFDKLNVITTPTDSGGSSGGAGASAGGIDAGIAKHLKEYNLKDAANNATKIRDAIMEWLQIFNPLGESLKRLSGLAWEGIIYVWNNVLKPMGEWAKETFLPTLVETLASALDAVYSVVKTMKPVLQWIMENVVTPIGKVLGKTLINILKDIKTAFDKIASSKSLQYLFGSAGLLVGFKKLIDVGGKLVTLFGKTKLGSSLFGFWGLLKDCVTETGSLKSGIKNFGSTFESVTSKSTKSILGFKTNIAALTSAITGAVTAFLGFEIAKTSLEDINENGFNIINTMGLIDGAITGIVGAIQLVQSAWVVFKTLITATNPILLAIAGISGAILLLLGQIEDMQKYTGHWTDEEKKLYDQQKDLTKQAQEYREELEKTREQIRKNHEADLISITNAQNLVSELENMVDENGKVIKGDKDHAEFIINQLNEAYGTHMQLVGDRIKGYDTEINKVKQLIQQKKAEVILKIMEEEYAEAIKKRKTATEEMTKAGDDLKKFEEEHSDLIKMKTYLEEKLTTGMLTGNKEMVKSTQDQLEDFENAHSGWLSLYYEKQETLKEWTKAYDDTSNTIINYEDAVVDATKNNGKNIEDIYNKTGKNMNETTKRSLINDTNAVKELTPSLVLRWETLANDSLTEFSDAINKMDDNTKKAIMDAVKVTEDDILVDKVGNLAFESEEKFMEEFSKLPTNLQNRIKEEFPRIGKMISEKLQEGADKVNPEIKFKSNVAELLQNAAPAIKSAYNMLPSILKGAFKTQAARFGIKLEAEGGFLENGELFIAREAGPEMVGKINGKTAVANNDQIVEAISIGVAKAMSGRSTNVNIIADGDTQGLMKFINFKQQQQNRQYGL